MKNDKLQAILVDLGLSENEAKVYLATLALGSTTILKISQAAEMKRTTVYSVVGFLKQKGLISIEIKGFKKFFVAQNPENLESVLKKKKEKLDSLMPEFSALYNLQGDESNIRYYEGLAAIKPIYNQLLKDVKPKDDYLVISDHEKWYNHDPDFFEKFAKQRAKLNINLRMLLQDSGMVRKYKKHERNYNAQIKILPKETKLTTNLVIIPKRVVIHQTIPPIKAITIENRSVVQMHKEFFEIMWKSISD